MAATIGATFMKLGRAPATMIILSIGVDRNRGLMQRSYEVSTGSGSDRVAFSLLVCLMRQDPVATAPGTDLITATDHRSHFNRQPGSQRLEYAKRSARRRGQIIQGNWRRSPVTNHCADGPDLIFLSFVLCAQFGPGFAPVVPPATSTKVVDHE